MSSEQRTPVIENGRVMERVDKPFVYGTSAFWQGKVPETQHSHRWTVYVRGLENEDLSYYIKSVTFALHSSFDNPNRVITRAPYEVTETGWGEFSIGIIVHFHDINHEPVHLVAPLKLFPPAGIVPSVKKPVMSEFYDEFVFAFPTVQWYKQLMSGPSLKMDAHPLMPFFTTPQFAKDEDNNINKLNNINDTLVNQIDIQRAKLFAIEQEIAQLTQHL